MKAMSRSTLKSCLMSYVAYGWTGLAPVAIRAAIEGPVVKDSELPVRLFAWLSGYAPAHHSISEGAFVGATGRDCFVWSCARSGGAHVGRARTSLWDEVSCRWAAPFPPPPCRVSYGKKGLPGYVDRLRRVCARKQHSDARLTREHDQCG